MANESLDPIYAKIFGNDTVQPVEEVLESNVSESNLCVSIKTAGGSVTITIEDRSDADDSLSA